MYNLSSYKETKIPQKNKNKSERNLDAYAGYNPQMQHTCMHVQVLTYMALISQKYNSTEVLIHTNPKFSPTLPPPTQKEEKNKTNTT